MLLPAFMLTGLGIGCGETAESAAGASLAPDSVDAVAEAAGAFFKAGFTDVALVQIGGTEPEQDRFFAAAPELITAVKETAGSS